MNDKKGAENVSAPFSFLMYNAVMSLPAMASDTRAAKSACAALRITEVIGLN